MYVYLFQGVTGRLFATNTNWQGYQNLAHLQNINGDDARVTVGFSTVFFPTPPNGNVTVAESKEKLATSSKGAQTELYGSSAAVCTGSEQQAASEQLKWL